MTGGGAQKQGPKGTVLVTGGAGYIGSHACKALAQAGYLPVAFLAYQKLAEVMQQYDRVLGERDRGITI